MKSTAWSGVVGVGASFHSVNCYAAFLRTRGKCLKTHSTCGSYFNSSLFNSSYSLSVSLNNDVSEFYFVMSLYNLVIYV